MFITSNVNFDNILSVKKFAETQTDKTKNKNKPKNGGKFYVYDIKKNHKQ